MCIRDRNNTVNNTLMLNRQDVRVDLARVNPTLAVALFAERAEDRAAAIRNILLPQTIHNYGGIIVRLLALGMDLWGTYTVWDLFSNLSQVTGSILDTVRPASPSPAPSPRSWTNGFGLLGRGPTPASEAPPPQGMMRMMFNFVISGGSAVGYHARLALAWFADYLHQIVGLGQTMATLVTFFFLTLAAIFIVTAYENGVRLWFGFGSVDTRPNSRQELPQQQALQQLSLIHI